MSLEPKTDKKNPYEKELRTMGAWIVGLGLLGPAIYYADLNTTGYVFLVGLMCTDVWLVVIFLAFQYI
jgi:hypothetical protein